MSVRGYVLSCYLVYIKLCDFIRGLQELETEA
jgi:hypothetical protein